MLPVLGICLGFQSLCLEFGAKVNRLKGPQHGIVRRVIHVGECESVDGSIFGGVREINATLYQSLCTDVGRDWTSGASWETAKWMPSRSTPDLIPLAWVEGDGAPNNSGVMDDRVLVAVRHRTKPFWALQYHPESICTNDESKKVIVNWFEEAQKWNRESRIIPICTETPSQGEMVLRESLIHQSLRLSRANANRISLIDEDRLSEFGIGHKYQSRTVNLPELVSIPDLVEAVEDMTGEQSHIILESSNTQEKSLGSPDVRGRFSIIALDVDDSLRFEYTRGVKFLTVIQPRSIDGSLTYKIDLLNFGGIWPFLAHFLEKRNITNGNEYSPFWGGFMGYTTYELGLEGICVESRTRTARVPVEPRPDLAFVWVTRSLVVDHLKGLIYIQDFTNDTEDQKWMDEIAKKIQALGLPSSASVHPYVSSSHPLLGSRNTSRTSLGLNSFGCYTPVTGSSDNSEYSHELPNQFVDSILSIGIPCHDIIDTAQMASDEYNPGEISSGFKKSVELPNHQFHQRPEDPYESKVSLCQDHIRAGNSYELCLTDQTTVRRQRFDLLGSPHGNDSEPASYPASTYPPSFTYTNSQLPGPNAWHLYRTLRARQPAPFASYIRLNTLTFVSASPERLLTYDAKGKCSLRPMKGTVKKSPTVPTLAVALPLLDVPKEKAENLMIVDLVRHDLASVCGSGNVSVPRLMVVEEYRSVFQMISVVEGQIPLSSSNEGGQKYTGLDVLAASLPPGSMTGAPKKRSCEILQNIEDKERSLYSGVVGYMDVGGRGDWSVNIRCMFRWDDEDEMQEDGKVVETWRIGAGGAVTTLSTPEGEREEMLTKLNGTLGVFR